jgi:hypothetical protein
MAAHATVVLMLLSATATYDSAMAKAVSLYNEAEWDAALRELDTAQKNATTDAQRVAVAMHQGIVLANVPNPDAARKAWRKALALDPKADLPLAVSPRVRALFQEVQREPRPASDAPKKDLNLTPDDDEPPKFVPRPTVEERHVPIVPIVSLGVGLAAGGIGLGFSLASNSELAAARQAQLPEQAEMLRGRAQTDTTVANVAFAVAGAAALTALVTFILID